MKSEQLTRQAHRLYPMASVPQGAMPWVPLSTDKMFKPLHFLDDDRGFAELIRFKNDTVMPRHRHTGDTHVFVLQGSLRLHTGEVVESGSYIFEPAGMIDSWEVVGSAELVILVIVAGAIEYLYPDGGVARRVTANTLQEIYAAFCMENRIPPCDSNAG